MLQAAGPRLPHPECSCSCRPQLSFKTFRQDITTGCQAVNNKPGYPGSITEESFQCTPPRCIFESVSIPEPLSIYDISKFFLAELLGMCYVFWSIPCATNRSFRSKFLGDGNLFRHQAFELREVKALETTRGVLHLAMFLHQGSNPQVSGNGESPGYSCSPSKRLKTAQQTYL